MMCFWALVVFGLISHCSSVDINAFYPYNESNNDTRLDGVSDTDDLGASISLNCGTIKHYKVNLLFLTFFSLDSTFMYSFVVVVIVIIIIPISY